MAIPRIDPQQVQRAVVSITAINLDTNTYTGWSKTLGTVAIRSQIMPGGHISIPARGEQWLIERISGRWVLSSKTDFLDERVTAIPNEEGLDVLGTMNGPTYVTGSRVVLPQSVTLSGVELRVNPDTHRIQYKDANDVWSDMGAASTGTIPTTAPTRATLVQTVSARATGLGQIPEGARPGPCTLTEVTYEFGTADASGSTVVELRRNGVLLAGSQLTVSAANQANNSGTEAARTGTGSWVFGKNDSLTVNVVSVGTTPGSRLTAHVYGTVVLS